MEVIVYTTKNCGYCKKAKEFLNKHGIPFLELLVDKETGQNLEEYRKDCPGEYTAPQILIDGKLIKGGYTGLITSNIEKRWENYKSMS